MTIADDLRAIADRLDGSPPKVAPHMPWLYIGGPYENGLRSVCELNTGRVLGYLADGAPAAHIGGGNEKVELPVLTDLQTWTGYGGRKG